MKAACKRGHPFTEENTYVEPKRGRRQCRTCRADRSDARRSTPEGRAQLAANSRRYYQRHPEACLARAAAQRDARDPAEWAEYRRQWRLKNLERERARNRAAYHANPEPQKRRSAAGVLNRRARLRDQHMEDIDRQVVFAIDHGRCGICGLPCDPKNFHVDHIWPLVLGGPHCYANCQPTHPTCNESEGARLGARRRWAA